MDYVQKHVRVCEKRINTTKDYPSRRKNKKVSTK
jgi:hypothetical protein